MSTREVLDHHNEAFGTFDVAGALEDYDDDSVVVSHDGVFRGLDEIREMFEGFFAELDRPDAEFIIRDDIVDGAIGYTTWEADSPENHYEFGTDTFIVEDDIIRYQTWAAKVTPK